MRHGAGPAARGIEGGLISALGLSEGWDVCPARAAGQSPDSSPDLLAATIEPIVVILVAAQFEEDAENAEHEVPDRLRHLVGGEEDEAFGDEGQVDCPARQPAKRKRDVPLTAPDNCGSRANLKEQLNRYEAEDQVNHDIPDITFGARALAERVQ